jgi:GNAT superfamily N-acetyltransferase
VPDAPPFSVVALDRKDRGGFDCGSIALNGYLQMQAGQDMKRRVAACFVAVDRSTGAIAGFYTLSACHVHLSDLAPDWQRKLPRYPVVPAVRLGRLAIALPYQGRKLGAALLANAVSRAVRSEIAVTMMQVEAKDEQAAAFYLHHGFRPDPENPLRLFAPVATLALALEQF